MGVRNQKKIAYPQVIQKNCGLNSLRRRFDDCDSFFRFSFEILPSLFSVGKPPLQGHLDFTPPFDIHFKYRLYLNIGIEHAVKAGTLLRVQQS